MVLKKNENIFIAESQSLNIDETVRSNILSIIRISNDFQDAIEQLERKNLIWYFIGPSRKDKDITEQINLKWEKEFQKFEQSINETHKKLEASLPGENFLVYTTKDNDFKIRFENKEKPIEISNLLRASDEGKVYNLSLGKDSQITATKKGSERHYNFTGSSSCEMTINWQAMDYEGNSIDCSMTVKLDSGGIQSVIGEPKFGDLKFTNPLPGETKDKILKLVEQNKEVFINGKTLHQAFTDIGQGVDNLEPTQNPSSQSLTPNSSGYFSPGTPSSRRSSVSTSSEFSDKDEVFKDDMLGNEEEYKQEGNELEDRIRELEEKNMQLRKDEAGLQRLNQEITEEGEKYRLELGEPEERVKRLEAELEKKTNELAEKDQDIERLEQKVNVLEQSRKDENARIAESKDRLEDEKSKVQSTDKINEELQKKLDQGETELSRLRAENTELRNGLKKMLEGLEDDGKKQLVELLSEEKEKLTDATNQLSEEQLKNQELAEELNQLQKETLEAANRQLSIGGTSLADEMSEGSKEIDEEIEKLKHQLKEKEDVLTHTQEELKSVKEALEQLQNILEQEEDQQQKRTAATLTQTEIENESKGTQASDNVETETIAPKMQDQGTQSVDNSSNRIISGLRQENIKLTRDKQTISGQLQQKVKEIGELKGNLKQLQEENKQLEQKAAQNTGVDASSSTDQKEIREVEVQTDVQMSDFRNLFDEKGEYVRTELSDPKSTSAKAPEKSPPLPKR
ncbi:MAG: hypothetical protein LBV62_01870 [Rickettsiales bacterium]|jgi:hypothetical protein|nr:hypothetical protein [Rickettsiales bacterium]